MPMKWNAPTPTTPIDDPLSNYSLLRKLHHVGDKVRVLRDRGMDFGDTWPDDTFITATAGSIGTILSIEEYAKSGIGLYPGELEYLEKSMACGVVYPVRIDEAIPLADTSNPNVHDDCHAGKVVKIEGCFLQKIE